MQKDFKSLVLKNNEGHSLGQSKGFKSYMQKDFVKNQSSKHHREPHNIAPCNPFKKIKIMLHVKLLYITHIRWCQQPLECDSCSMHSDGQFHMISKPVQASCNRFLCTTICDDMHLALLQLYFLILFEYVCCMPIFQPQLAPLVGDIPRSTFQFDFDFERKILAEAEKESQNWNRIVMESPSSKAAESTSLVQYFCIFYMLSTSASFTC